MTRLALFAAVLAGSTLAVSSASARTAYVTSNDGNCGGVVGTTVSAVDIDGGAVKKITGFSGPAAIAIAPDGKRLYVGNQGVSTISIVETASNSIVGTIPLGASACRMSVSPDGSRLYTANGLSNTIGVIDTTTDQALAPVVVGTEPYSIATAPDNSRVYVGREATNSELTVLTLPGPTFLHDIPLGPFKTPLDLTVTPDGQRVYVSNTNSGANSIQAVSTVADAEMPGSPIPVNGAPLSVTSTPDGKRIYVASGAGGYDKLIAVDTATNTEITTGGLPVPIPNGAVDLIATPDGGSVLTTSSGSDALYRVSTSTNQVIGAPIALDPHPNAIAIVPDQAPTASFTLTSAEPGKKTTFNGGASSDPDGTVARYDWNFGDGQVATNGGATPSHVYAKPGVFTASLTVTDNEGGSTERVYTGKQMLRNGGPSASKSLAVDTPPGISGLRLSNKRFATAAARKKVKRGTQFRYTLTEKATVKFSFARKTSGRRSGKKCKAMTKKNASKKKCTLYKSAGNISAAGKAGKNATRFSGKVRNKKLRPASYRATLVATDSAKGASSAKAVSFKVVRR